MQPRWLMALLMLLKEAWSARRDAHIPFLKIQVEMLEPGVIRRQSSPGDLLSHYSRQAA